MAMQEESHASGSIGADADADAGGLAICFDPFSIIESHPHMYGGMSYVCVCVCARLCRFPFVILLVCFIFSMCVDQLSVQECLVAHSTCVCVCARLALVVEHYSCAYICSPI
jgi:hypothetical protein